MVGAIYDFCNLYNLKARVGTCNRARNSLLSERIVNDIFQNTVSQVKMAKNSSFKLKQY